mgnify:CR=1 FL=1
MDDKEVIFTITKQDVIDCAKDMGLPEQVITNIDILLVKKYVEWGLDCWSGVVEDAINIALKS